MFHTVYRFMLATVFCAATGCKEDESDEKSSETGAVSAVELNATCQDYCDQAKVCDAKLAVEKCVTDCKDRLGDCKADEQTRAVDDLRLCTDKVCGEFPGCTIGAGLKCTFGL